MGVPNYVNTSLSYLGLKMRDCFGIYLLCSEKDTLVYGFDTEEAAAHLIVLSHGSLALRPTYFCIPGALPGLAREGQCLVNE